MGWDLGHAFHLPRGPQRGLLDVAILMLAVNLL